MFDCQRQSLGQTHDIGHVFGAGAASVLLGAAMDQRFDFEASSDIEPARALGSVEFMPRETK